MLFGKKTPLYGYEILREGEDTVMRINYENAPMVPSLEDSPTCMSKTMDNLIEARNVTKIVFVQKRDYEYDFNQTSLLMDVVNVFTSLVQDKDKFGITAIEVNPQSKVYSNTWFNELQKIVFHQLKSDPIGAYVELRRILRREHIHYQKLADPKLIPAVENYMGMIKIVLDRLEKTKLITISKPFLAGYQMGDREIYRKFLHPVIKPDFMFTKLMADYPIDGEEIDNYMVGDDVEVTVFRMPTSVQYTYHLMPPEFKLSEDEYEILDLARNILAEHKPTREEFTDPERMRQVFWNVGRDLLEELVAYKNVKMAPQQIDLLARILVRYTIGFGLIEVLLMDERIQDISVNSPQGRIPLFIVHADSQRVRIMGLQAKDDIGKAAG